jgi:hypothetical protein
MGVSQQRVSAKTVDNWQNTVDNQLNLWRNGTIIRIMHPQIWRGRRSVSNLWIASKSAQNPAFSRPLFSTGFRTAAAAKNTTCWGKGEPSSQQWGQAARFPHIHSPYYDD